VRRRTGCGQQHHIGQVYYLKFILHIFFLLEYKFQKSEFEGPPALGGKCMATVRCTMAQALVPYLCDRGTIIDGERASSFSAPAMSPSFRTRSNRRRTGFPPGQIELFMAPVANRLREAATPDHGPRSVRRPEKRSLS
jgi:hypothetical protein